MKEFSLNDAGEESHENKKKMERLIFLPRCPALYRLASSIGKLKKYLYLDRKRWIGAAPIITTQNFTKRTLNFALLFPSSLFFLFFVLGGISTGF